MSVRQPWVNILAGITGLYVILVVSGLLTVAGIFMPAPVHRAVSLVFALLMVYLRALGTQAQTRARWFDLLWLLAGLAGAGYVALFYDSIVDYSAYGYLDRLGTVLALLLAVSLLEAVRRVTDWSLPIVIVLLLALPMVQQWLPGILRGPSFDIERLTYAFWVGASGIFGLPMHVAATIVIVFLIFGRLLQKAGAGQWFMDIAVASTGWTRGGPAKAAVIASGLCGSITGSPTANVATTGVFTIPLMIKTGYRPAFAGAVEAAASTGGMIMPPVMGTVAFVMAEWLEVPYAEVVKAALIPALLYYVVLFFSVHLQAGKAGIQRIPREQLPRLLPVVLAGWHHLPPLAALIYFLIVARQDPEIAGLYTLPVLVVSSFLSRNREFCLTPLRIWHALVEAVIDWVPIAVILGAIGMMIGALELSGLGIKFSDFMLELSGGNLLLTLIMVGLASVILGMGVAGVPAYVTLAILSAPALITLGLLPMQAHLYVIYWGMTGFLTPPVCVAVYVACSISGSRIWETGVEAMRVGAGAFLISIAFALNPALLLIGPAPAVVAGVATALLGAVCVAAAFQGYGTGPLNRWQRVLVFVSGLLLLGPGLITAAIALALLLASAALGRLGASAHSAEKSPIEDRAA
ncbi:MAG: TRAP transporter [Betaproteobacteria bacterium RIFCSPLOWO2_12_FULL_63_13]|nr:MAG: TRAP transporter [Betaproteobacteria bacterium RIFCSPLOWO2_12_FULL_63_13]